MKKIYFLTLLVALLLPGCRGAEEDNLKSEIFGSVAVIDENGKDITKYCSANLRKNGIFLQKAAIGNNSLHPIICTTWYYIYNINLDDLTIDVPNEKLAVYFGDITISLNSINHDYNVIIHGKETAELYSGPFPVKQGDLEIGPDKKHWSKSYIDGRTNIMLPGWPNYEHPPYP